MSVHVLRYYFPTLCDEALSAAVVQRRHDETLETKLRKRIALKLGVVASV